MIYKTEIEVKTDPNQTKGSMQLVCVLYKDRDTDEIAQIRLRTHPIDPDMAIIAACKQVLGIKEEKGTSLNIRPTDEISRYQVLGAWLLP